MASSVGGAALELLTKLEESTRAVMVDTKTKHLPVDDTLHSMYHLYRAIGNILRHGFKDKSGIFSSSRRFQWDYLRQALSKDEIILIVEKEKETTSKCQCVYYSTLRDLSLTKT